MRIRFLPLVALVASLGFSALRSASAAPEATVVPVAASSVNMSRKFDAGVFQAEDGAITIINNDERVDAYFATKALLTAHEAGLDIREAGMRWVNWLLPLQHSDGRFMRYTRQKATATQAAYWKTTDIADADDALLAIWIELLYTLAPNEGLPVSWQKSISLAGSHLQTLRDRRGYYWIARENRVGLFMDNSEIYSSMMNIAREQGRLGHNTAAAQTTAAARNLAEAIHNTFWDNNKKKFRVSTQIIPDSKFYPDATAQVFPMLTGLDTPAAPDATVFNEWLAKHGDDWITMRYDDFPWGLVAFAAWKVGDNNSALEWQNKNRGLRYGNRWTVLDEAIYQALDANLPSTVLIAQAEPRVVPNS
ncbi:MAG TPA: hypothetical protein VF681_04445 [Abditibacteriaceae bacterium]|jgi:hypothetical protein